MTHKVKWKVSLSNGETFYEGKPPFEEIPNQKSPFQRVVDYSVQKKTVITSLSLYTDDNRTFNLPSLGKNPKFQAFHNAEKPIDFNLFRAVGRDSNVTRENEVFKIHDTVVSDHFTVAEAIYHTYKLQLWVDERNTNNSWVLVV